MKKNEKQIKKKVNIVHINGMRGYVEIAVLACCLAGGFILFPGQVLMYVWNFAAGFYPEMPSINVLQGILLWGIIVFSYFILGKQRLFICSGQGLTDEELKAVFADLKAQDDKILQEMLKEREAELKAEQDKIAQEDTEIK